MEFINDRYHVVVTMETMPDLTRFDIVHNPEKKSTTDFHMARILKIQDTTGNTKTVALVDIICSGYEPCAVLEGNTMTVILFQSIVRIDLDTGALLQYRECDNSGGLFQIHAIDDGYLIWGEGEIFRYDRELNQIWWFAGRDILVSPIMDRHFWIDGEFIHCRDFEHWHYVLDFSGKLIENFPEIPDI